MSDSLETAIRRAADLLRPARKAVVFTGAGISTPSGIPDFRSADTGLWERFDPMKVASIEVFRRQPEQFYNWLRPLLQSIWAAQPNAAHMALADLERNGFIKAVITQNIDDLHQRAGSKTVYEVHGSLRTMTCMRCHNSHTAQQFHDQLESADKMPHCPECDRVLKPDITLFGEMLPTETWLAAERACKNADVILVAGSSLEVWPAASLPELGVEHGARLIINNMTPTYLDSQADVLLPMDVSEAIPRIAGLLR
jgi:NAD-dependent deacetylase